MSAMLALNSLIIWIATKEELKIRPRWLYGNVK
jgi:hypothetical protein